jgi:hypothetical protein
VEAPAAKDFGGVEEDARATADDKDALGHEVPPAAVGVGRANNW